MKNQISWEYMKNLEDTESVAEFPKEKIRHDG